MKGMTSGFILLTLFVLTAAAGPLAQADKAGSNAPAQSQVKQDKAAQSGKGVVIGYLHTRDKVVTISRGSKGAVYTVKNKAGKVLALNLNEKAFRAKYPALYDQVRNGLAGDATLYKDASPLRLR